MLVEVSKGQVISLKDTSLANFSYIIALIPGELLFGYGKGAGGPLYKL
jgi:hypothetical protein